MAAVTAAMTSAGVAVHADDDADLCMPPDVSIAVQARDQAQSPNGQNPQNPQTPQNPPPPAEPAPKPRPHLYLGPDIGVFIPTSGRTRNAFGGSWFDFGLGLGPIAHLSENGRFAPDLHFITQAANGNRMFFGLVGVEYRRPFGVRFPHPEQQGGGGAEPVLHRPDWVPYVGASADLMVGQLRDVSVGEHSVVHSGGSGSLFIGINFRDHAFFEARYREDTVIETFDLSGFSLNAGYRFRF